RAVYIGARLYEIGRRIVADEAANQFCRDESGSARMLRKNVDDFFAVTNAAGIDFVAKNNLRAVIVDSRPEHEFAILLGPVDGPSRKRTRDFLDILLRVA